MNDIHGGQHGLTSMDVTVDFDSPFLL